MGYMYSVVILYVERESNANNDYVSKEGFLEARTKVLFLVILCVKV